MSRGAPFRTRARAVDHLGRGQIADAPTAVSELWKNAYDAYARNVYLYLLEGDGSPPAAAVFDDGHGMTAEDFLNRWLVIGTEAKVADRDTPAPERFGLPVRERQGEKGIGRLSAAFLAPVALLISKKVGSPFAAALVDWRLFENPLLDLQDVFVAVEEFADSDDLFALLPGMADTVRSNVTGRGAEKERAARLAEAWRSYSAIEAENGARTSTAERIRSTRYEEWVSPTHLEDWPAWLHEEPHGTALLMFDLLDLRALVSEEDYDSAEVKEVRKDLIDTLKNYTDPFDDPKRVLFDYEINVRRADGSRLPLLSSAKGLGPDDFYEFEHWVDGAFDDDGHFKGKLRAFGGPVQDVSFSPAGMVPRKGAGRPGRFELSVCTTEQLADRTSHVPEVQARLNNLIEQYGGMNVFRDGLRVLPYGREDADLFQIELERSRNAGRAFWSYRRLFGRIAVTRSDNPRLRDKAGREGLVDNAARRTFERLVRELLKDLARRYYGSDSKTRPAQISEIQARRRVGEKAARSARIERRKEFKQFLKDQAAAVEGALEDAREVLTRLNGTIGRLRAADAESAAEALAAVVGKLEPLLRRTDELRPPLPPPGLEPDDEAAYRAYRDSYGSLVEQLETVRAAYNEAEALATASPRDLLEERYLQLDGRVRSKLDRYRRLIEGDLAALGSGWVEEIDRDRTLFSERAADVLESEVADGQLVGALNALDVRHTALDEELSAKYDARVDSVRRLRGGMELSAALAVVEDRRADLERRVRDLEAVAQLGISVEIIGHELEVLDEDVERNLARLPDEVKALPAYKHAYEAHRQLTDRLRFLSPLQLAGYRQRQDITGEDISTFVADFFERRFERVGIEFTTTEAFNSIRIVDLPSRINPVFLNLVNNAMYWAARSEDRKIVLDFVDGKVVVADSGPGVDPDDVPRLFTLFFSRRDGGRGVGLYLARANLAAAHHTIRYARPDDPHVLPGANFIIEFRGVTTD